MSDGVNVVLYGVGHMGKLITRYLVQKGFNIVGAINRTSHIGEDLGRVANLDQDLGVIITDCANDVYRDNRVDIALLSTTGDMESLLQLSEDIVPRGVHILTLSDQGFWPWRYAPEISHKLDELARENKVTITASGMQDTCLLNVVSALTGGCNSIDSMSVTANANLDFYGPAVLEHFIIGVNEAEYNERLKQVESEPDTPPIFGFAMEALAADLGLTINKWNCYYTPIFATEPVTSQSLGRTIEKGLSIGHTEFLDIETTEGITLHTQFIEQISPPEEPSILSWEIKGVPDIKFTIDQLDGEAVTCASLVNRIVDVIDAEPGLVTCERLPGIKLNTFCSDF